MTYLFIGSIVGLVMGLTGAGGALVAIPLFMVFLDKSLKEASVLSLMAVILSSIINFTYLRKYTNFRSSFIMFVAGLVGSYSMVPVKKMTPDVVISFLLTAIAAYSLFTIWKTKISADDENIIDNPWALAVTGVALGVLTTLTGLGGGVLLMPLLMVFFHYSQRKAVATSLLTIALTSTASLIFQLEAGFHFPQVQNVLYLTGGIIISVFILKAMMRFFDENRLLLTRQLIFSAVVIFAIFNFFYGV
jgi:uncharacterized protein